MNGEELRFRFGRNWSRFLVLLDETRIRDAERSLQDMLGVETLAGARFLDAGSGSGLFSLAARRLGARVHSFDYDAESVACTEELRRRYFPEDAAWTVERGSVLDREYVERLGSFDVVYSWGVLHHTGAMWSALETVVGAVCGGGRLFIAIYNDQGGASRRWAAVKRTYNALPDALRFVVLVPAFARLWAPTLLRDAVRGMPGATWRSYRTHNARGMSAWYDLVDWVGGYPFEVAKPEEIFDFLRRRGFSLDRLTTCGGGLGCNEFVLTRGGGESRARSDRLVESSGSDADVLEKAIQ